MHLNEILNWILYCVPGVRESAKVLLFQTTDEYETEMH